MGRRLDIYLGYGVFLPEVDDSAEGGYDLISRAKYTLSAQHGNPRYHHEVVDRPPRDQFSDYEAWKACVTQMEDDWYKNDPEGRRRKALNDEWDAIGIDYRFSGIESASNDCLVDVGTLIATEHYPKPIRTFPEAPTDFLPRLEKLIKLSDKDWKIEKDPSWLLFGSFW